MNISMIRNALKKNKGIHLALWCFMALSTTLAVISIIVAIQTFSSIHRLYETAQPPHFLQMHKGELDEQKIADFMKSKPEVVDWQVSTMVDVYGNHLTIGGVSLADCRIDLGLVKQNPRKDLLLNTKHEVVQIQSGEVGIPMLLKEQYDIELGDEVLLSYDGFERSYTVTEFILDAQMNSSMCSSTRILLSDEDFGEICGRIGENEFLIEAYFKDSGDASSFQTVYESHGMPQNGVAVTYTMIFLLSALTDLITVFLLIVVCLLLTLVAFLCVKYTILATIEEELSEIGTLKAIGLPQKEIISIYLLKYRFLAILGVVVGTMAAYFLSPLVTGHISETFGTAKLSPFVILLSMVTAVLMYGIMIVRCKHILKKIRSLTVVDTLVTHSGFQKTTGKTKDGLHRIRRMPTNGAYGIWEVVHHFIEWMVVFLTVWIASLLILIPINLVTTIKSKQFSSYMGSVPKDLMIEIENGSQIEANYETVSKILSKDSEVDVIVESRRVCLQTIDVEGRQWNLHTDTGLEAGSGLQYLSGKAPTSSSQIAISYLNADALGKKVGDTIDIELGTDQLQLQVSGIYQDVTSGGYTAKAIQDFDELAAEKYSFLVDLKDEVSVEGKAKAWNQVMGDGVNVDPMEDFLQQTLGGVTTQVSAIVGAVILISALIVILITVLFLKLRLAKDRREITILKAVGFTLSDLTKQYLVKVGGVSLLGILAGVISTQAVGGALVNVALGMTGLGIKQVHVLCNPLVNFLLCPVFLLLLILIVTVAVMRIVHRYEMVTMIQEV